MKKIKDLVELVKLANRLNSFTVSDVDIILRCPYGAPKAELMKEVNLSVKENIVYQSHYLDGLTKDNVARKLAVEPRQVERIKTQIKQKCHAVWRHNITAISLLKHLKVEQLDELCLHSFGEE